MHSVVQISRYEVRDIIVTYNQTFANSCKLSVKIQRIPSVGTLAEINKRLQAVCY